MAPYLKVLGTAVGKKHLHASRYWIPSAASYGAAAVLAFVWIYDFEPVMKKIPFIRRRFMFPYEDDKRVCVEPVYEL